MTDRSDHDLLIELNIKMDVLSTQLATHIVDAEKGHADRETRIRALEQWKWRWAGALALVIFVWNLVSAQVVRRLLGN